MQKQIDITQCILETGGSRASGRHIRRGAEIRLDPMKTAWFAILGFYVQRYASANRSVSFGFVKTSVKIAALISGLDAVPSISPL